ncbi:MAG: efflux RND transporter periplasmic adaptor subunit [Gammaproteobacteria bacterium]|nr:efflux RND transporter periplasmic adaptor subunit [Gammaproteobacteria bacterium]MCB1923711.1 efflux RND transporter periplasmic adaptor subunit [Gammaproteobacteria bacterium]
MFVRFVLVILLLGVIFGGIFGWKQHAAEQAAKLQAGGPPPAVISASTVRREQWPSYLRVVGSLDAVAGIEVTSEVGGQIASIHFRSGQSVEQGELLVALDDDTDQAQLQGLLAERSLAQLKYDRTAKLVRDKSVSKSDYDEARATLDSAEAQVAAQKALIEKKRIRAPFSGRLGIRRVDVGEYLTPGAPIVPLEQLDPIYVDFTLPERELAHVTTGQAIEVQVQAYPDQAFAGAVEAIDPGVEVGSRSFRVRARLGNAEQKLRPGMFADVRVILPQDDNLITVPDTAISYAPYGDSVFVVSDKDGKLSVERRQIETGRRNDGRVAVVSGLADGERVVSAGHNKLRNGQAVTVDAKPAPGERTAATGPDA